MTRLISHVACLISGFCFISTSSLAADGPVDFDERHKTCLEAIGDDAQQAYESALQWKNEGGANFWLTANEPDKAYASASAGLKLAYDHLDLRIARARAYALSGRYDYAETDLTSVLSLSPNNAEALRYRADAKFRQDKMDEAQTDIEASLAIDPTSVETALLRGKIREAVRLAEIQPETIAETIPEAK